ncbi:MAG: hypothetical protein IH949_08595 [Bacteroidetes bacterium]|nr:hypothetical protein [Bacteroidota bacterium]
MSRKIDALHRLYTSLVDCHYILNFYGNITPQKLQEYKEKIEPKMDEYLNALVMSSLYLNEEQNKVMGKALGAFRQASMAIWLNIEDCPLNKESYSNSTKIFEWTLFSESFDVANLTMRSILNPKVLEQISKIN